MEMFMIAAPTNFTKGLKEAEAATGLRVRCLVTDAFFGFAGDMAEEMEVAWVPVCTAGPRSLLIDVERDLIRQTLGTTGEHSALDFVPGFSKFHSTDLPGGIVLSGNSLDSHMSSMMQKLGQNLRKATAVAINSFDELDPEIVKELKSRFHKFLNVGPFSLASPPSSQLPPPLLKDESGCLEWLEQHKPASVAYVGFGSMINPPPRELASLVQALLEVGVPFLWSFSGKLEDVLPKGCDKISSLNGKIVSWAPQAEVLGHASIGVFVTHCGWNSVLESIVGGAPMICRPFFGDQMVNTKTVEFVWGIGVGVEGGAITKDGAIKALELIFKSTKQGNEMRERIKVLKNLALQALQCNGTSTRAFNTLVRLVTM